MERLCYQIGYDLGENTVPFSKFFETSSRNGKRPTEINTFQTRFPIFSEDCRTAEYSRPNVVEFSENLVIIF